MLEQLEKEFTKYEIARILGARALQIAMDAPLLLKINEKELEDINYNPIEIAKKELISGVLPITVNRPLPKKKESKFRKLTKEELDEMKKKEEELKLLEKSEKKTKVKAVDKEVKEEPSKVEEILKKEVEDEEKPEEKIKAETIEGEEVEVQEKEDADEIMELATPEDEVEEEAPSEADEGV